ncbi:MAG: threonine--tRNA ligase [Candidatus Yanofskybacteria bacterium]|nr:threonine--tRNA ligase [Candidatus Yanofskybacteria bacterium]
MKTEQVQENDHKKLGPELDLFAFSDAVGKGLPLFTPKGATIRRELERFIVDEEIRRGYQHVITPDIAKLDLYRKSGHYPHYKHSMYAPIKIDDEEFMLRPMTCPHHFELYLRKPVSYRELPMRIAELAKLYRYEQSGELMGLQRVRTFCLADAHIICVDENQAVAEMSSALDLIEHITGILGLTHGTDYWYQLSLGDRSNSEKYYKNDAAWEKSENLLREMLEKRSQKFTEAKNEAAFYGPKIDIQMKNANGKEDTAFTVQYDFCMPDRFDLSFVGPDGEYKRAFVVHRSSIGAIERIMAFLIERYTGAFPVWLAPTQVAVLSITDKQNDKVKEIAHELSNQGIRVEVNTDNETIGKKIRAAEIMKIPYILVIGAKEADSGKVAVRKRGQGDLGQKILEEFISKLKEEIASKA